MPSGQHGSPFSPLRIGTGCNSELPQRLARAVTHGDELVAPLGHRLGDQRLLLGQWREFRWVGVHLGGGERLSVVGQHTGQQCRHDCHDCLSLMRCCIFCACSRISWVISKCPPNSLR